MFLEINLTIFSCKDTSECNIQALFLSFYTLYKGGIRVEEELVPYFLVYLFPLCL